MNPAFVIIVVIAFISIWFLSSALYKPIGKLFHRISKDAIDQLTEKDEEEKEKHE